MNAAVGSYTSTVVCLTVSGVVGHSAEARRTAHQAPSDRTPRASHTTARFEDRGAVEAERSLPSASARLEQRGGRPSSWSLSLNGAAAAPSAASVPVRPAWPNLVLVAVPSVIGVGVLR
jgi:hypothetical protein